MKINDDSYPNMKECRKCGERSHERDGLYVRTSKHWLCILCVQKELERLYKEYGELQDNYQKLMTESLELHTKNDKLTQENASLKLQITKMLEVARSLNVQIVKSPMFTIT